MFRQKFRSRSDQKDTWSCQWRFHYVTDGRSGATLSAQYTEILDQGSMHLAISEILSYLYGMSAVISRCTRLRRKVTRSHRHIRRSYDVTSVRTCHVIQGGGG